MRVGLVFDVRTDVIEKDGHNNINHTREHVVPITDPIFDIVYSLRLSLFVNPW